MAKGTLNYFIKHFVAAVSRGGVKRFPCPHSQDRFQEACVTCPDPNTINGKQDWLTAYGRQGHLA